MPEHRASCIVRRVPRSQVWPAFHALSFAALAGALMLPFLSPPKAARRAREAEAKRRRAERADEGVGPEESAPMLEMGEMEGLGSSTSVATAESDGGPVA